MGNVFKIVGNKSGETGEGGLKKIDLSIIKTQKGKKKKIFGNQVTYQIS